MNFFTVLQGSKNTKFTSWVLIFSLSMCLISPKVYSNNDQVLIEVSSTRSGVAYSVNVREGYAFITDNDGVSVYDLSDPRELRRVSHLRLSDGAFDFDFEGSVAYIAADEEGIVIADFQNLYQPEILGTLNFGSAIFDVAVEGDFAYLADISNGLRIVDISDAVNPFEAGHHIVNDLRSVEVIDDAAYLAVPDQGLIVLDISDPYSPSGARVVRDTYAAINLHLGEEFLFVSCHNRGTKIMDVKDPFDPVKVGEYSSSGGESFQAYDYGEMLFIADVMRGVRILNISDPENPQEIASFGTMPHDVFHDGEYTFLANERGLEILQYGPEDTDRRLNSMNYFVVLSAVIMIGSIFVILYLRPRK